MADKYNPGMEFQSWTSLPSVVGALMGQQTGAKNPLLSAIGYGINQMAGSDTDIGNIFKYGQTQAPQTQAPIAPPQQTQPSASTAAVPPGSQVTLPSLGQPTTQPQATQPSSYTQYLFR